jgi:transposase
VISYGLTLCYLPPYSPQLNIIETLWRFMKYVWIEYSAYLSWENMMKYIQKVFDGYGTYYQIDFNGYS